MNGNVKAPEGQIWVCGACGKQSRFKYGFDKDGHRCGPSYEWDESCVANAVLCYEKPKEWEQNRPHMRVIEWIAVEPQP